MQNHIEYTCKNQTLILSAKRAVFWKSQRALLVADLHLGKAGHFRKSGIPLPASITLNDLLRLGELIEEFKPVKCFFLGDLFHSDYNNEFLLLKACIKKYATVEFILIKGNHDIVADQKIKGLGIAAIYDTLEIPPFQFTHHPQIDKKLYNFAGHLHPGYRINGLGRQSLKTPVFYFGAKQAILPAFSAFSGKALIKAKAGDHIFGIVDNELIKIKP